MSPWGFVGMAAMASVLFLVVATAWVCPWWVTVLFVLVWLAGFLTATRWFVPHPGRVPWVAVVVFLVWAPVVSVGARAWGWS